MNPLVKTVSQLALVCLFSLNSSAVYAESSYNRGIDAYLNGQYQKAREAWHQATEEGNASAAFDLGLLYARGIGGPVDEQRAAQLFAQAARSGLSVAQYYLGLAYYSGRGIEQDMQQARLWWELAAQQGDDRAQFNLGALFWNGEGIEKNATEALSWFRSASDNGNDRAREFLDGLHQDTGLDSSADGTSEIDGEGDSDPVINQLLREAAGAFRKKDYQSAFERWKQAADKDNAIAQFRLANLYREGLGVAQDPALAFEYTQKAAQQKLAAAQYQLGLDYLQGGPVEKNETLALYWLQSAADQGHEDAKAYLESIR